ncbi:MAG TPA: prepilin-type N-terminal cleavage/methylation domain-containing protein [Vicinamibacterales bacterium]|nr:prepilin-type N-terminal cleavage/methylation domain-containing protein [Vicinamibacterales bacterium]
MSERGYSLVELIVSLAILLAVFGSVCQLASPAHATAIVQAELQDMQQRARVVRDRLTQDLWLAGAGTSTGQRRGPVLSYFSPLLPAACCGSVADPPGSVLSDRLTIAYVPRSSRDALTTAQIAPASLRLDVSPGPSCPSSVPVCGFADGELLVVFDDSGRYDVFTLDLSSGLPMLSPVTLPFASQYDSGATVARVVLRTYYRDPSSDQLFVVDDGGSPEPVVDRLTALRFEYRDAAGVSLDAQIGDGPWRGAGATLYDADLLRVRRVRVTYTIRSGLAGTGAVAVPDLTSAFEIALRNAPGSP